MPKEEERLNAIKEELEEMIEQIKSEVDKKDQDLAHFKKRQDESFDMISYKMKKLKEDFKTFGKYFNILKNSIIIPVLQVHTEMENLEGVQRDSKNKLLSRIDEVHDDVKQLRQIVDTNLEDIANELMAKNSKVSGSKIETLIKFTEQVNSILSQFSYFPIYITYLSRP